jgi:hypothetical protein
MRHQDIKRSRESGRILGRRHYNITPVTVLAGRKKEVDYKEKEVVVVLYNAEKGDGAVVRVPGSNKRKKFEKS